MRNLVPLVVSQLDTAAEIPLPLSHVAVDQDTVFCCFASPEAGTIALHSWSPETQWDAQVQWPLTARNATVVGLRGDSIDRSAVVVMSNGDVVAASLAEGMATIVGSLEIDVDACGWSPDGEVLCLVLRPGRVLFLSASFEELGDHFMLASDLALAEKHVSVGWGKRETQFQGRGAKRDPTLLDRVETREPSAADDGQAYVSWRGDGEYVVINAMDRQSEKRALRVFSRAGELTSVSEPVDHLLGYTAWQPAGALIACVKHASDSGCVQFFERNGLRRHSFEIPTPENVTSLAWSADSVILSVAYRSHIDLWTMKNYHWYRKQTIAVHHTPGLEPLWHPEKPRTLVVPGDDGIQFRTYRLAVAADDGLVAVIDNNSVKVTPLAYANMPPPMAFAQIDLAAQPAAVAVQAPNLIAVATDDAVKLFQLDVEDEVAVEIADWAVPGVRLLSFSSSSAGARLLAYTNHDTLLELVRGVPDARRCAHQPPLAVTALFKEFYLCNSQVYAASTGALIADLGESCLDFIVQENQTYAITRSGKLLHGDSKTVLSNGVTSMALSTEHLLFTTMSKLIFVHLMTSDTKVVPAVPRETDAASEQSREIERGSLLVSVVPSAMTAVLQAPRGNIETIFPRMLVLGSVRRSVAERDYLRAFQTCKVHRIDLSILYDINPEQFLALIPEILQSLGTDTQVDLLLSAMSDEDVTKTKYVDTLAGEAAKAEPIAGKANSVLDAMLEHLSPQCKITALALKQPPQLADALVAAAADVKLVKHLCFLSDAEQLYRTALGVYDPKLALVVAQQAQMDPKEYIPFLRARESENVHRRRFNIDLYLRNYDKALASLVADEEGDNDSEIVGFVERHGLYQEALQLLRPSNRPAKFEIMELQAQKWLTSAKYVDAGCMFEALGQRERASDAYVLGGDWRKALALAPSEQEVRITAARLAEGLEVDKKFGDAAHLFAYYLSEPQRAIECYCLANQFDDAILVGKTHGLAERLGAALRESFATFEELLADCAAQVPAQLRRLRELRAKRDEDALGFEQQLDDLDVADNLSVAGTETTNNSVYTRYTDKSSVGTAATNATRRTAKNQRRQERKRAMGKKGSVYEEEYLVSSTARLIERLHSVRADLQSLVVALERCDLAVYAGQLVAEDERVLGLLREHTDEVFAVDERALVRYDQSGHEYIASAPAKPPLPEPVRF